MLNASSISMVLDAYRPERATLLGLLEGMAKNDWARSTECPLYTIKGVATHILGDDLSLLSRQRDVAENGLVPLAVEMSGADFRTLLDTFNDRWVASAGFLSAELLMELLGLTGEWTASYYEGVDPDGPGESVGLFGARRGSSSPFWQAIAREYLERWIHHSQIRRALALGAQAERNLLVVGMEVAGAIARLEPGIPATHDDVWCLGPVKLGTAQQAAEILTRGHSTEEVQHLAKGPEDVVRLIATVAGRP
jgi:hypothetical protein